jgi:hypothetical protein
MGSMTESGIEAMLEGLSWAEQMELEEQLADAQGKCLSIWFTVSAYLQ